MDWTKYETTIPYPLKAFYTTIYVTDKGELVGKFTGDEWNEMKDKPEGVAQKVFDEDAYKDELKAYNADKAVKNHDFMEDLFEEFDVQHDPRRTAVFAYAETKGHSSGKSEVYNIFQEMVEHGILNRG